MASHSSRARLWVAFGFCALLAVVVTLMVLWLAGVRNHSELLQAAQRLYRAQENLATLYMLANERSLSLQRAFSAPTFRERSKTVEKLAELNAMYEVSFPQFRVMDEETDFVTVWQALANMDFWYQELHRTITAAVLAEDLERAKHVYFRQYEPFHHLFLRTLDDLRGKHQGASRRIISESAASLRRSYFMVTPLGLTAFALGVLALVIVRRPNGMFLPLRPEQTRETALSDGVDESVGARGGRLPLSRCLDEELGGLIRAVYREDWQAVRDGIRRMKDADAGVHVLPEVVQRLRAMEASLDSNDFAAVRAIVRKLQRSDQEPTATVTADEPVS